MRSTVWISGEPTVMVNRDGSFSVGFPIAGAPDEAWGELFDNEAAAFGGYAGSQLNAVWIELPDTEPETLATVTRHALDTVRSASEARMALEKTRDEAEEILRELTKKLRAQS